MKTYKNLWEKFKSKENFEIAFINSIKGKSKQKQVIKFMKHKKQNLQKVRRYAISGHYHTSDYIEKVIYEPKKRVIYKLPYSPDRIVQHSIMNVLKPILTNLAIENSFACVEGRGPQKASLKCSEYVRKYKYCLKCDIRKFYPSIDQDILSSKLHRIIKDDKFMQIVDEIIYSYKHPYGFKKNCPIGNYCSQWFGNFYLSFLDNYILHALKPGGYERYCDDFLLFDDDKKKLQDSKMLIERFLWDELELEYSKATLFTTAIQGVDFCGYRHFKHYKLLRKTTAKRLKKRYRTIKTNLSSDFIDPTTALGQLASGNGLLKHACTYHLRKFIDHDNLFDTIKEMNKVKQLILYDGTTYQVEDSSNIANIRIPVEDFATVDEIKTHFTKANMAEVQLGAEVFREVNPVSFSANKSADGMICTVYCQDSLQDFVQNQIDNYTERLIEEGVI